MFKKIIITAAMAAFVAGSFAPIVAVTSEAEAKGFSSSRSFSRSSFRSSSSSSKKMFSSRGSKKSSSSKKSFSTKNKAGTDKNGKKFSTSKNAASSKFTGSKKTSGFKKVAAGKQTRQAKNSLKAQRSKFIKPSYTSSGSTGRAATTSSYKRSYGNRSSYQRASNYDRSTYYTRRNQYYGNYQPPMYVYRSSPSYGMWDTIFLYSMLSSMNNNNASRFAYNHQNDADYQQWRREADRLSQDNAELRTQLAQIDAGSAKYAGQAIDPDYIPKGIDADIAMSQEVLAAQKPTMRVCVGENSGTYFRVTAGVLMQSINSVNIVPVTTSGTGEILDNITNGKCDAGFVQGDGYWNYVEAKKTTTLPFERVASPYKEAVHLICNDDGPSAISKLSSKNKVWFPPKSGAAETWKNFVGEEEDYGKVQTVLNTPSMKVSSYEEAILKVRNDKNSCAMYVGAPNASKFVRNVESAAKKSNLVLIDINDNDLNDTTDPSGRAVYKFGDLKGYKQLNRNGGCYGYCSGSIESLFVNADFIVSNKWKDANTTSYSSFALDLMGVQPEIETAISY